MEGMSSPEGDERKTKYEFKGKFGATPSASHPIVGVSQFDVDAFVRHVLGLTKNKGTESTTAES
jgi:hypothetical protein